VDGVVGLNTTALAAVEQIGSFCLVALKVAYAQQYAVQFVIDDDDPYAAGSRICPQLSGSITAPKLMNGN
jgi:hypothetical protein